jgi:hypothetical protein
MTRQKLVRSVADHAGLSGAEAAAALVAASGPAGVP